MSDWELLGQYVESGSESVIAEIVRRHFGWVRAAAQRQVGDEHLAEDVTQAVFLALARQAKQLLAGKQARGGSLLSTWLFQVTRYAAATALRGEGRRRKHERQAAEMKTHVVGEPGPGGMTEAQWSEMSPMLEKLVGRLKKDDQQAVLLRFYEKKNFAEVGAALGVSEEAARKRTDRAVGKLREMFERAGATVSAAALGEGLCNRGVETGTNGVEQAIQTAVGKSAASSRVEIISKGAMSMMKMMKMSAPAAVMVMILLLVGIGISLVRAEAKEGKAEASGASAAATTQAAEENTPKGVFVAAYRAAQAGDAQGFVDRFTGTTPAQVNTLKQIASLMSAAHELTAAVKEKFGADMEQEFSQAVGSGVLDVDVTSATETVNGDAATIDMGGAGPGQVAMVKVGGKWKVDGAVLKTLNLRVIRQAAQQAPAMKKLAADVREGKYKTVEELKAAMQKMGPRR